MPLFRKILVPLDGSANAEGVLPWARKLAGPAGGQILLLRVVGLRGKEPEQLESMVEDAGAYLAELARRLREEGYFVKARVRTAMSPARNIAASARRSRSDVVVLMNRGGSPVARWLVGGVAENVMRLSAVPVFLVRTAVAAVDPRAGRILLPLDGSEFAESILPWAESIAGRCHAGLTLFHVDDGEGAGLLPRLEILRDELRSRGVEAECEWAEGDPAEEILRRSERESMVIAMGTHGFSGLKRWVFGSVAEKVIHGAAVPVFIYKEGRKVARPVEAASHERDR